MAEYILREDTMAQLSNLFGVRKTNHINKIKKLKRRGPPVECEAQGEGPQSSGLREERANEKGCLVAKKRYLNLMDWKKKKPENELCELMFLSPC